MLYTGRATTQIERKPVHKTRLLMVSLVIPLTELLCLLLVFARIYLPRYRKILIEPAVFAVYQTKNSETISFFANFHFPVTLLAWVKSTFR